MRKLLLALLVISSPLIAQQKAYKVELKNRADIIEVTKHCSIESAVSKTSLLIYADSLELNNISQYITNIEEVPTVIPQNLKIANDTKTLTMAWDSYPDLQTYLNFLNDLQVSYPQWVKLDTIGYSNNNRPLIVIHISGTDKPRPEFLYSSTIHGNELTGFVLLMRFADYLASNYRTDSPEGERVSKLLDNLDMWIMPLNNPDGTYYQSETTVTTAIRGNKFGRDLNRNFPDQFNDNVNTTTGRETETKAMMEFVMKHNFSLSANFHTGMVVMNYPWDGVPSGIEGNEMNNCPDSVWFYELSKAYADQNPDFLNSTDFPNGITNGGAWYNIFGGKQDWMYKFQKGREVTIELSMKGYLSPSELLHQWDINQESLLRYAEMGKLGIHGKVTDESGNPISSIIRLKEIPETDVITNSANGFFARYVHKGTFNVEVIAENHSPITYSNINMIDTNYIFLDVKFAKGDVQDPINTSFNCYLNNESLNISNPMLSALNFDISIYDLSGRMVSNSKNAKFDKSGSALLQIQNLGVGTYFVVIDADNKTYCKKIVKL